MKVSLRAAAALLSLSLVPLGSAGAQMQPLKAPAFPPATSRSWEMQNSTTKAGLRGIHAVGNGIAWASGTNGTILRTEDGGYMWQSCAIPPGAEELDFRGIWAWDANTAVAMSSGPGDLSRLYKTIDGCSSWKLLYTNPDKDGFWDAIQFWDRDLGMILGDPVGGLLTIFRIATENGSWTFNRDGIAVKPGTAAFAASNSSIVLGAKRGAAFQFLVGTGGLGGAQVVQHFVAGQLCECGIGPPQFAPVLLASGTDSSGVFSLAFRDQDHGVAVGGDYKKPNKSNGTAAYTTDGGKTWTAATKPPHGYRSSVAWDASDKAWIAVGTNGSDVSYDDGKTWQSLDNGNWNALSLPWVVGTEGRIAKLVSLDSAGKSATNSAK